MLGSTAVDDLLSTDPVSVEATTGQLSTQRQSHKLSTDPVSVEATTGKLSTTHRSHKLSTDPASVEAATGQLRRTACISNSPNVPT